jgi:uncharacterized membrane protein YphA (DoxX/SURF4 family)
MENVLHRSPEILLLLFLIITFLQSGADKLLDWRNNLAWLKEHFGASPFKNIVPFLLTTVMVAELCAALLCLLGLYELVVSNTVTLALYGAIMSCIALLMLLLGQRIARDYEGAKTITVYFLPAVFLVYLLVA